MINNKKQIIFIITDTQRQDMVGAYGIKEVSTPNLDRLADGGSLYTKAYTTNPVCGPARSSIFTGLYPHTNGSTANSTPLLEGIKTMGHRFKEAGFKTGYIGKWHLDGGDYFGNGTCPDGWDEDTWYDMRNYLEELTENERITSRKPSTIQEGIESSFTFGHRCSTRAIEFIEKNKDNDFLLVVSYDEPHGPSLCPIDYYKQFTDYEHPKSPNVFDTLKDKPEHHQLWAQIHNINPDTPLKAPAWFGCNSYIDSQIGRVLDTIEKQIPNSMVLYTSDHGGAFHSHRLSDKGPAMYEEITKIPFIMKTPTGKTKTISNVVSHIDILPTFMDYAGLMIPKTLQGKSLLKPHFDHQRFIEYTRYEVDHDGFGGYQPIRCIVTNKHKLVINLMTSDELYDLETDPHELTNLIDHPEYNKIRNTLHDTILDWMYDTRDPFRGYYWYNREWRTDASPKSWSDRGYTRQKIEEPGEVKQLNYADGLEISEYIRKK